MSKHWLIGLVAIGALALVCSSAQANVLTPGTTVAPDAYANLTLAPGSMLIADTGVEPLVPLLGGLTGTFREQVIQESAAANPLGGYTFVYQISDTTVDIGRLSSGGWTNANSPLDVGTATMDTGGATLLGSPGTVNAVSADWTLNKATVGWNFGGASGTIGPGEFSYLLAVRTSNKTVAPVTLSVNDGGAAAAVAGFAPGPVNPSVPEPSTMALAGLGALGLIGYGLRRKSQGA